MRYSSALTAMCLASSAWSAAINKPRQDTVISTISTAIASVEGLVTGFSDAFNGLVSAVGNTVNDQTTAVETAQAVFSGNIGALINGLNGAAAAISSATLKAGGNTAAAIAGFTQAEVDQLNSDLSTVQSALSGISINVVSVGLIESQLGAAYQSELQALGNSIITLTTPLLTFSQSATSALLNNPVISVTALQNTINSLSTVVNRFTSSLGLGSVFQTVGGVVGTVAGAAGSTVGTVGSTVGSTLGSTVGAGQAVGSGVGSTVGTVGSGVGSTVGTVGSGVTAGVGAIGSGVGGLLGGL
ncbi:hypothetical protein M406DRAFT_107135 [Cryphonectria parasitica EP155]|uniref:Uncharacterized protein n=1 Tax=Cryphonectria parasitica (strain ATCC 38755 / EP155) TaxID=660469 RepID=A0A9P5CPA2_CRYP1|nr:uncharacterized protein M406DRAFT_107135 [Cryphonectria parasitica EP155]KAF3764780.1 hypothetical protein M406DRAFT_107135 [Cryphonectria parasitica EP155]